MEKKKKYVSPWPVNPGDTDKLSVPEARNWTTTPIARGTVSQAPGHCDHAPATSGTRKVSEGG